MNILITGGGTGIGLETAKALAAVEGVKLFIVGRNQERLATAAEEIKNFGHSKSEVVCIQSDIGTDEGIKKIAEVIFTSSDSLELLINNAGILVHKPADQLSFHDYFSVYSANVFGVAMLSSTLFPLLKKGKLNLPLLASHVVNLSSMGGIQGSKKFPGLSAYSSSKGALITLGECLAEEWSAEKVHVNTLAIGSVETEMFRNAFPGVTAGSAAREMGRFVADFALNSGQLINGKVIQVASSTP
jgi:3-oxoacyl-[acyl-carrier protein] reductase